MTYTFHHPSSHPPTYGTRSTGPRAPPRKLSILLISLCVSFGLIYYLHITGSSMSLSALYSRPKYQWKPDVLFDNKEHYDYHGPSILETCDTSIDSGDCQERVHVKIFVRWVNLAEYGYLNGPDIHATDPRVIFRLRNEFLVPPVPFQSSSPPYNLTEPGVSDPSMGQSQIIRKIFKDKLLENEKGFFVECGALDGETRSNTLYLERFKKWTGLLIEADPSNFEQLKDKHRRSYLSPTCLSTKPYPEMVSFEQNENMGKISDAYSVGFIEKGHVDVQCFPFESYMLALNRTHVDYFSLDVEGAELSVLKTIDFQKFDISTLSVEFIHDVDGKLAIKEFMTSNGYFVLTEVTHPNWLANDYIFVNQHFYDNLLSSEVRDTLDAIHKSYEENGAIVVGDKVDSEMLI